MAEWRPATDLALPHFQDLKEVREATGTAGAFSFDTATEEAEFVAVADAEVGASSTWGADSGATAYVDRDRVWLDGGVATYTGSGAIGTLPAGKRPAATTYIGVVFGNDFAGTPTHAPGLLTILTDGTVTLTSYGGLTGTIFTFLTGLSFKVAP